MNPKGRDEGAPMNDEQTGPNVPRDVAIRKCRAEGMMLADIGRLFGLTRQRIEQIVHADYLSKPYQTKRLPILPPMSQYQRLIENAGFEFEYGMHDSGDFYFVRIWDNHDERIFTSKRYTDLPTLFSRAAEVATRTLAQ